MHDFYAFGGNAQPIFIQSDNVFWEIIVCFLQTSHFPFSRVLSLQAKTYLGVNSLLQSLSYKIDFQLIRLAYIHSKPFPDQLHINQILHPLLYLSQWVNPPNGIADAQVFEIIFFTDFEDLQSLNIDTSNPIDKICLSERDTVIDH